MSQWKIDADHATAQFKVQHRGISWVRGIITEAEGTVDFDPSNLTTLKFDASINVGTINTGLAMRDGHLKSPDFFDVAAFPKATLKSIEVKEANNNVAIVSAELTIKNITKEVTAEVNFLGESEKINQDGSTTKLAAFSAVTRFNREDFGLTWNMDLPGGKLLVGTDVELTIDVEVLQ
jgi:polyisoprenoid-binding protein YceI